MNLRVRLLHDPRRLPEIVGVVALLLLPLAGALPLWVGRGTVLGEFLAPVTMALAGMAILGLIILAKPLQERREDLTGIPMALQAFGVGLAILGLISDWAGLPDQRSRLEANPAAVFGAAAAGLMLFGAMARLRSWAQSPDDQEQS